jgi:hypothetical protein
VANTTIATAVFNSMNCGASTAQGAIGCLAGHLLAVKLDLKNGSNPCITSAVTAADTFLASIPYTGPTGTYAASLRDQALALKEPLANWITGGTCI